MKMSFLAGVLAAGVFFTGVSADACAVKKVPYPAGTKVEGAASVQGTEIDHADSIYYMHPDFYEMKSNAHRLFLHNYPTYQQTTEYT